MLECEETRSSKGDLARRAAGFHAVGRASDGHAAGVRPLGAQSERLGKVGHCLNLLVGLSCLQFKGSRLILGRIPFFAAALSSGFREGETAQVEVREARASLRLHQIFDGNIWKRSQTVYAKATTRRRKEGQKKWTLSGWICSIIQTSETGY